MLRQNDHIEQSEAEEEEEEDEEAIYSQMQIQPSQPDESEYVSVNTQQKDDLDEEEELKHHKEIIYENLDYYGDERLTPTKFKATSEVETEPEQEFLDYNIFNLRERGILIDKLPIRSGCFNRDYIAIGTNSKCLKICNISNIINEIDKQNDLDEKLPGGLRNTTHAGIEEIPVIFDQLNHHEGSIYCIDWTE